MHMVASAMRDLLAWQVLVVNVHIKSPKERVGDVGCVGQLDVWMFFCKEFEAVCSENEIWRGLWYHVEFRDR